MKTISKYHIETKIQQSVKLPADAQILSVQVQNNIICMWALATIGQPMVKRQFEIFGTGEAVTELPMAGRTFLGTVQLAGGKLVFHVFEKIERRL